LVLLSNTNAIHIELVRQKYPVLQHFHHLVLSHEVKSMKPDPAIYREAIANAHCLPGECFYTDDIAENIEAGKRMGLDAVLFESREQIEGAMRARGIEW
jgi:putative hydrolase of the HAD superfamily